MRGEITLTLFVVMMLMVSCSQPTSTPDVPADEAALTRDAADTATAMMAEVRREFTTGQTATAVVEKAVEHALTTAVAAAVAETLTAVLPEPSQTPLPLNLPAATPTNSPLPPPTETPTSSPTQTTLPPLPTATVGSAGTCTQLIDSWCATHQGCSTVDVRNQSGLDSSWHIWSDKTNIDATFTLPPGPCTLVTRPGKYNFYITYCGDEVADFAWQLNDNWWYKISPCDG